MTGKKGAEGTRPGQTGQNGPDGLKGRSGRHGGHGEGGGRHGGYGEGGGSGGHGGSGGRGEHRGRAESGGPGGEPLARMEGISKRFGTIQALDGVSFTVIPGEIQVILGENGAGKSTLMNVLIGLYQPDEGEVFIDGQRARLEDPRDGLKHGIAMVPQHVELVGRLTVWENVVLGDEGAGMIMNRRRARAAVHRVMEEHALGLDVDAVAGELSAGQQQKVEILKVLYRRARVLILDEPTTFLTPQETDALYETLRSLAARGMAVLVVTHKLRDAMTFGHRLTVMRGGLLVAEVKADEADEDLLIQWLMGIDPEESRRLVNVAPPASLSAGAPTLFRASGLNFPGDRHRMGLKDIQLEVREGEIHGIAGVAGAGQRELADLILGLFPAGGGAVSFGGRDITRWPVHRRLRGGIVLIPEDRIHDAILPAMPLYENAILGQHRAVFRGWRFDPRRALAIADDTIAEYKVKAPDARVPIAYLSGGNMQKVIVARAVQFAQQVGRVLIIASNPTRGLDVRTVRQVRDHLREVAARGNGVILMSEDLDELTEESHTISVMYQGSLVASFTGPDYDRYQIGEAMLGRYSGGAAR